MLKAVELAHLVAEAQLPGWRQPTLPRPPTLKAVKLAFPLAPPHASRMRLRLQSRQLGSSPLSTFAAQGTSALTATRRRDCCRRSRPQTRSSARTNGLPAAPVCSRPASCSITLSPSGFSSFSPGRRCKRLLRLLVRRFKGKAVTVGGRQTLHKEECRPLVRS